MKGIVIDKGNDYSVLLLSDGTFKNIKNCNTHEVGDVIYTGNIIKEDTVPAKKVISMIAAAFILVFLGTGAYVWATPVQYINIDINPSVELMVNRFDRIIKVNSLNDDGRKLIENLSINARHYEAGIAEVIDAARNLGYLEEEGNILISISSADAKLSEKTQAKIREKVNEKVEILTFDTETYKVSVEEGLSPGKSNIIEKVIETGNTQLSKEELVTIQVKDLMILSNASSQSDLNVMSTESRNSENHITNADEGQDDLQSDNNEKEPESGKEKSKTGLKESKDSKKDKKSKPEKLDQHKNNENKNNEKETGKYKKKTEGKAGTGGKSGGKENKGNEPGDNDKINTKKEKQKSEIEKQNKDINKNSGSVNNENIKSKQNIEIKKANDRSKVEEKKASGKKEAPEPKNKEIKDKEEKPGKSKKDSQISDNKNTDKKNNEKKNPGQNKKQN